jgi:hypothetical protein
MNYLTNYYKNLSEQLQEKLNHLEKYVSFLSEDLASGTIEQGAGPGAGVGTGTTTNQNNDSNDLNALLQAWGSSNPQFDLNRDGVVDGDDLGLFLANMLNRGQSSPVAMASTALPGTPETETIGGGGGQKAGRAAKALDQPGLASGRVGRMFDVGAGAPVGEKKNQTPPRLNPKTPYSPEISPSTAKFSPAIQSPTPGNIVNIKAKGMSSNKNRGVSQGDVEGPNRMPPMVRPKTQGGLSTKVSMGPEQYTNFDISQGTGVPSNNVTKPGSGSPPPPFDITGDGFVDANDSGLIFANWGPVDPGSPYDFNQDGFVDGTDMGLLFANWGQVNQGGGGGAGETPPEEQSDQQGSSVDQENVPYWMSGKTTKIDTGFRSMQRRRKK